MMLLILELCVYACSFICGIVTATLVTLVQVQNEGKCLLYGTLQYNNTTKTISVTSSCDPSLCNFVLAIPVCVTVLCFFLICLACCVGGEGSRQRMCLNITLGIYGFFMLLLITTGCLLKIGRDQLCQSLPQPQFKSCEDAQNVQWVSPNNGSGFYSKLYSAEISVWVNFFCLFFVSGLAIAQRSTNMRSDRRPLLWRGGGGGGGGRGSRRMRH